MYKLFFYKNNIICGEYFFYGYMYKPICHTKLLTINHC